MNAKGISPVIATVLLILVAVAVTLIVASFVTGMTSEQTAKAKEEAEKAPGAAMFAIKSCTKTGAQATIVFENLGSKDLNSFTVFCLDASGNTVATVTASPNVAPGATSKVDVTCTTATTRVKARSVTYTNLESERDCS